VNTAYKYYFEGNIEKAEKMLEKILEKRKNDYRVWLLDALIKNRKGELDKAFKSVEKSIELKDDNYEAWTLRATILRRLGRKEEALDSYSKAIDLQLKQDNYVDYELYIEKAKILIELGNLKMAKKIIKEIEELNPEDDDFKNLKSLLKGNF